MQMNSIFKEFYNHSVEKTTLSTALGFEPRSFDCTWEMVERLKTDVDGLLLVLIMNNIFPIDFAKIEHSLLFKPKVGYIYVCFYLLYYFPYFKNQILFILDGNI